MSNSYESERLVWEYLLFHYGKGEEVLPWAFGPQEALDFPKRIAERFSAGENLRGLDVGCAVGRSSFEMSRFCEEVIGIDFSAAFVAAAGKVGEEGRATLKRHVEAALYEEIEVKLPEGVFPEKVRFEQGDAMNLRADLGGFDRVLAANLLCLLPQPMDFINRLGALVNKGGELILTTPATWLEEFTAQENWPKERTAEWLQEVLSDEFELLEETEEPFLIRETARKFQWTVAHLSRWRRKF